MPVCVSAWRPKRARVLAPGGAGSKMPKSEREKRARVRAEERRALAKAVRRRAPGSSLPDLEMRRRARKLP